MSEGGEGGGAGVCGQPSRLQPNLTSISPNRPTNGNQIISNHQPQLQVVSSASTSRNMTRIGSTNSTAASWSSVSCANNGFNETGSSLVPSLTSGSTVIPNLTNSLNQRTTNSSNMFLMGNTRKRPGGVVNSDDEPKCKRRKISEEMTLYRLKKKQRMMESLMELFYYEHNLTSPVSELYEVWRKKPSTPALLNYLRNNLIDASDLTELLAMGNSVEEQLQLPEMKIAGGAGASVTPVAVSTTLPAAVARLSQQGQLPGRPIGGRHGMVFASRQGTQCTTTATCTTPLSQILPLVPGGTPLDPNVSIPSNVPDKRLSSSPNKQKTQSSSSRQPSISAVYDTSIGSQEQIVEKAKQEAHVIQRIGELQREGLWAEKRLPKVHEPARAKAHWDYLLEEMVWLAADFAQERKWKKAAAKKCARMVQKHFQEKEQMAQKAVKSKEMQLKRIAGCMAKEIKQFWTNVEKLVEYKQQTRLEEKRKKALDQHLSFIVDQTEKYSTLVAESMNKTGAESVSQSLCSSRAPSPTRHSSDIEFEPGGSSSDDEETIAKEEAEEVEGEADHSAEIEMLQKESELPLDELLKDYLDNRESIIVDEPSSQDDEFHASGESSDDDEETIKEQETAEGKIDYKQELVDLEMEGQMSLDELVAKYGAREETVIKEEPLSEVEDEQMETSQNGEDESMDVEDDDEEEEDLDEDPSDAEVGTDLSLLLHEDSTFPVQPEGNEATDKEINDVAALAESIQPTGNTLTTTSVGTKIPFLLKHTLREYQHIGLDWLVTMYDRKLNGILADEMGLGKTIQTISVLAHLACEKGNWGPHLIIVPTSVMLNWEMEFMKWCPAFKILTYYGSQKERRMKRTGWTKPNAFHVCITSYKLVIQDHQSFRRKKWKYLILDEAQNIKNFKSQRWQLLLNFQTQRRLLLTGTPLQNNLMELWSLMHFLMPNVFQSHREFKEWFSNPVTGMIEGNSEYNEQIIKRLHKVLRPFLLRRLKTEVEKQLPKKYEHIIMCRLSNRQRYLYDDFMSRAKTRETLASGNMMSVINVLMQLRKVCNHPNLFEVRPTVSPFQMEAIKFYTASIVWCALDYNPFKHVNLSSLNLDILNLDTNITAYTAHRMRKYRLNNRLIEEIDSTPPIPRCPAGKIRIHVKFTSQHNTQTQVAIRPGTLQTPTNNRPAVIATTTSATPKVGTSPLVRTAIIGQTPTQGLTLRVPCGSGPAGQVQSYSVQLVQHQGAMKAIPVAALGAPQPAGSSGEGTSTGLHRISVPTGFAQLVQTTTGRHLLFTSSPQVLPGPGTPTVMTSSGQRLTVLGSGVAMTTVTGALTRLTTPAVAQLAGARPIMRMPPLTTTSIAQVPGTSTTQSPSIMVACATSSVPSNFVTTMASSTVTTTVTVTTTTTATTVKTCNTVTQPVVSTNSSPSPLPITSISSGTSFITTRAATVQAKKKQDEKDAANAFIMPSLEEKRKLQRRDKLRKIGEINTRRCTACPMYGMDLVQSMRFLDETPSENDERLGNWMCSGHLHCYHAHNPDPKLYWHQTNTLSNAIISIEQRLNELKTILSKFVVCVPAVNAPQPKFHVSHPPPWKLWQYKCDEATLHKEVSQRAGSLHPIISSMMTQFPDPRLIQYDCGKLQALDKLLRKLKSGGHRVLIFTQMTRMLDVLEAFLNHHGHIYLRLDGTTKVDQRQALMERFNADKRIFCFILSTRSGGIGVNLTGADTVIFYDSDWNPTMDAQAQDRCHRIGQTRDVHIYRLISEKTVEENILKKANQKRMLGDLAIEGGNFTTAYFKSSIIQDLFDVNVNENDASTRMAEVLNRDTERRHNGEEAQIIPSIPIPGEEKSALGVLESALAAAEDETDVVAAKTAKAEAVADLEEFDESIPLDQDVEVTEDISRAEQEVNALVQQLSAVERYAMRFIEETDTIFSAEQLAAAEAEIEQQKLEWEKERLQALHLEEERQAQLTEEASEELLTFTREDSTNQIWVSENGQDQMPMWCPPTPPQDESDIYIDHALAFLYEPTIMSEALLPSVFIKKDRKRSRIDSPGEGRHPMKVGAYHREETPMIHAPKSLFDRPSPALVKMRHDLRLQKYRGGARPPVTPPGLKQVPLTKPPPEPEHVPEWLIHEDCALLQAVQAIQELLLNLMIVSPGHTPNWEMVADMVNMVSRIYRSPKQCKNRYESVIIPREEGKILESNPKKQKKTKGVYKMPQTKSNRPMRTAQLYTQDNNISYSQLMNSRFESIRIISNKRTPTVKPFLNNPEVKNPKHAEVLAGCGINYDSPLSPVDVAQRRADRIAKDKLAAAANYEQQLAFLRGQVGTGAAGTSAVAGNSTVTSPSTTPNTSSQRPGTTLTVQEVVNVGSQVVSRTINSPVSSTSPQRVVTANITAVSQSPTTMATKVMTTGKLSTAHIQVYQHRQAILRQQQLKALQSRAAAAAVATGQKVSVAVTGVTAAQHQARMQQQVKQGGLTRAVTETEMAAILKRQALVAHNSSAGKAGVSTATTSLTPAQILAQAGLQAQQPGQIATLVKTVPGQTHIPVTGLTIPQVKAALGPGVKTATPQQIRQLTLQQQLLAQRKLPAQKVAQLGQVMVTNKPGVPAQLIVQSQKSAPSTMTMQQIQQVIKHVHPQHIAHMSASGQTVVTQATSGQVISHAVLAKAQQASGSAQARVIPVSSQQNLKQTIQVVTASPGVRTSVPNVTIDSAGRPSVSVASALAGAIKVGTSAQQQALLSQVSAALQQGQQISVRQNPVRIQAAPSGTPLVAVAVSQASTLLTLPQQSTDNVGTSWSYVTHNKVTNPRQSPTQNQ